MPQGVYKRAFRSTIDRFNEKYRVDENGCWQWLAYINPNGYGAIFTPERPLLAHRFAYEHFRSRVKNGLELDHLCRNRSCVNPYHLEEVTRRENTNRGLAPKVLKERQKKISDSRKYFCKNGHDYSKKPAYVDKNGVRHCRECKAESQRRIRGY